MTTADLIKGWRIAAGLTRMQLASRIDRYVASVSAWERGATCSAATVAAIGRACGVPDLQRLEAVAQAAGEGEGWARVRKVLGPVARGCEVEVRPSRPLPEVYERAFEIDAGGVATQMLRERKGEG